MSEYSQWFQVFINNGFTPDKDDYEFCTRVENMIIPETGYFGISAATGGLAGICAYPNPEFSLSSDLKV